MFPCILYLIHPFTLTGSRPPSTNERGNDSVKEDRQPVVAPRWRHRLRARIAAETFAGFSVLSSRMQCDNNYRFTVHKFEYLSVNAVVASCTCDVFGFQRNASDAVSQSIVGTTTTTVRLPMQKPCLTGSAGVFGL